MRACLARVGFAGIRERIVRYRCEFLQSAFDIFPCVSDVGWRRSKRTVRRSPKIPVNGAGAFQMRGRHQSSFGDRQRIAR